jgi:hypothetical protein
MLVLERSMTLHALNSLVILISDNYLQQKLRDA